MNLFLHSIAPVFLIFHVIAFIDRSTNIPTGSTLYRYALAIASITALISLSTLVSRKLDENKQSANNKLPLRFGRWVSFWYRFNPSKINQSLLSEIRREYGRVYWVTDTEVTEFDWNTIVARTNNFCWIGEAGLGGSGTTTFYNAVLPPNEEGVAVKRFTSYSGQGLNGFMNEILLVPKLDHPNIIKLFGYCIHKNEKLLVYELMTLTSSLESEKEPLFTDSLDSGFVPIRGSLHHMIDVMRADQKKLAYLRQWSGRFKIIMGIAQGVAYLHHDSGLSVVHGDLKLSNILLDSNMNPKISGFASARSYQILSYSSSGWEVHMKSDVYRFGVIVLMMVSGRTVKTDSDITSLVDYASKVWIEGVPLKLVDKSIDGRCVEYEMQRCIRVGLLCTLRDPDNRPLMTSVLKILQTDVLSSTSSDAEDDHEWTT